MSATISGGDKMRKKLDDLAKRTTGPSQVNVGFMAGATYPDGHNTPVAAVAAWQEFGTRRIPSRPFFRNMIKDKSPAWGKTAGNLMRQNNMDVEKVLNLMGMGIKAQLQQSIIDLLDPPLSAITLMLRKMRANDPSLVVTGKVVGEAAVRVALGQSTAGVSTKPLIDTGHLLQSVDYEVK